MTTADFTGAGVLSSIVDTVELHSEAAPNEVEYVIAWLRPLGLCDWNRPSGETLPYRMVNGSAPGEADGNLFTSDPVVSVHTFHSTYTDASDAAGITDRRMNVLVRNPGRDVTLQSGVIVNTDYVEPLQAKPFWVDYGDTTIHRFVARYRLGLSFVAVS